MDGWFRVEVEEGSLGGGVGLTCGLVRNQDRMRVDNEGSAESESFIEVCEILEDPKERGADEAVRQQGGGRWILEARFPRVAVR